MSYVDVLGWSWRNHLYWSWVDLETTKKLRLIRDNKKATHDRQKSYADRQMHYLEFWVGDQVFIKVQHMKYNIRFGPAV